MITNYATEKMKKLHFVRILFEQYFFNILISCKHTFMRSDWTHPIGLMERYYYTPKPLKICCSSLQSHKIELDSPSPSSTNPITDQFFEPGHECIILGISNKPKTNDANKVYELIVLKSCDIKNKLVSPYDILT